MPRSITYKENLNLVTEEDTLSRSELRAAARSGDTEATRAFDDIESQRRSQLPAHYDVLTVEHDDGSKRKLYVMKNYYRRRVHFAKSAKLAGIVAAVGIALLSGGVAALAHHASPRPFSATMLASEVIADVLIVIGTFFTARGAFLGMGAKRWLEELDTQHSRALNEQKTSREAAVTRQLMSALSEVKAEIEVHGDVVKALDAVCANLSKSLSTSSSGFSMINVLTNRDIAGLFLDASGGAVLGSAFIIGGTLALTVLAFFRD